MARDFKVILSAAVTLCGRIGPMPVAGRADRERLLSLRSRTCASLMGANTLREADPEVAVAGGGSGGRIRAFVSASGRIPCEGRRIFDQAAPPLLFTMPEKAAALAERLGGRAEVVAARSGPGGLDLAQVVRELFRRGRGDVLIEGGGRLNHSAIAQGVVDEIHLTIAPRICGDPAAPLFMAGHRPVGAPFAEFSLEAVDRSPDGDAFLVYCKTGGDDSMARPALRRASLAVGQPSAMNHQPSTINHQPSDRKQ